MIRSYSKQRILILLGLVLLLEAANIPFSFRSFIKIDFFLIFLVFHAFYIHRENTLMTALFLGFLEDTFSNSLFGVSIFAYGLTALYLMWITRKFDRENPWVVVATTAVTFLIYFSISFLFHLSYLAGSHAMSLALIKGFTSFILTVLFAWPFVKFMHRMLAHGTRQLEFRF